MVSKRALLEQKGLHHFLGGTTDDASGKRTFWCNQSSKNEAYNFKINNNTSLHKKAQFGANAILGYKNTTH